LRSSGKSPITPEPSEEAPVTEAVLLLSPRRDLPVEATPLPDTPDPSEKYEFLS